MAETISKNSNNTSANLLRQKITTELLQSLSITPEDRQYWLDQIEQMPPVALQYFYDELLAANLESKQYLAAAITQNPEHLNLIKQKLQSAQKHLRFFEEKQEQQDTNVDANLEEQLKNL